MWFQYLFSFHSDIHSQPCDFTADVQAMWMGSLLPPSVLLWVRGCSLTSLQECIAVTEPDVSCVDELVLCSVLPWIFLVGHRYLLMLVFPGVTWQRVTGSWATITFQRFGHSEQSSRSPYFFIRRACWHEYPIFGGSNLCPLKPTPHLFIIEERSSHSLDGQSTTSNYFFIP